MCSYLEYEHEFELTRVSYCVYVNRVHNNNNKVDLYWYV